MADIIENTPKNRLQRLLQDAVITKVLVEVDGFGTFQQYHPHLGDLETALPDSVQDLIHVWHAIWLDNSQSPEYTILDITTHTHQVYLSRQ